MHGVSRSLVRYCVALTVLAAAIAQVGGAAAQTLPIHYYNGASRVDLLIAGDELVLVAEKGTKATLSPQAAQAAGGRAQPGDSQHALVKFDTPSANRAGLASRARALRGAGGKVAAVAYRSTEDRSSGRRIFIPSEFSLQAASGVPIDELLRNYSLRIIEKVPFAKDIYVVTPNSDELMAGIDAANALIESGQARSATPLILQQQTPRLVPNDSYFSNQWHLRNTGQVSGFPGNDVNIVGAWDSYTGTGINIAISDSGVQTFHTDLSANARTDIDLDINGGDLDPTPQSQSHGTSCAGIAAAKGQNGQGVVGAAFNAGIVGIRLIEAPTSDLDEANAMNHQANAANPNDYVHVNSNSWGPTDNGQNLGTFGPLTEAALINGVTNGRGGKGIVYVWAGGNGRQSSDNVNYDGYASSRYTIAVGATGADGSVSYYSEPGASLLVNAPSSYSSAGTTTTAFMNGGNLGAHYTSSFGGTSSAAPLVAGVVGLILEANPNLGWRDVQHILVESAEQNDPGNPGWAANGAGHLFNHNYGFGRVDALAAVTLAQGWTNVPSEATPITGSQSVGLSIPDNNNVGITSNIVVSGASQSFSIETVEVTFNATHTARGNLQVVLTAPSGQQSVLALQRPDFGDHYSNWKFTSVAHWDENPNGTWSLQVKDLDGGTVGTFNSWSLTIHGYENNPPLVDTDGDGLPDIYEDDTGTYVDPTQTGSDPNVWDSDGDGVMDGVEVSLGTDPNNPLDFPVVPVSNPFAIAISLAGLLMAFSMMHARTRSA